MTKIETENQNGSYLSSFCLSYTKPFVERRSRAGLELGEADYENDSDREVGFFDNLHSMVTLKLWTLSAPETAR